MKKKQLVIMLAAASMLLTGCIGEKQYEVANYQGLLAEGETTSDYNKELFYRNEKKTSGADPFVLDNTERDGYYYQYVTEGSLFCYRSTDMMEWEPVGNTLDNLDYAADGSMTEYRRVINDHIWAPEVVYDEDTELYYMFFSASPIADDTVVAGVNGVEPGTQTEMIFVATSKYAYKEFQLVNFKDAQSCGAENLHTYDEKKYPHYFSKYLMFDCQEYRDFSDANGGSRSEGYGGHVSGIDPTPFVDENGDKYLYWVDCKKSDRLVGVKMINWLKPDWSTATTLTYHTYYTVDDWKSAQAGGSVQKVSYELESTGINEGPQITKHGEKYYMTFSVNDYRDSSYQVAQAVADQPLGPYRKLTEDEGGILISGGTSGSQEVSGTGHHTMLTIGEKLYIYYHRHDDFMKAGALRNGALDEVKWITIKDKDGNELDVMYTNGPTWTVQPKIDAHAEYVNIAEEAKVSGSEDVAYLNDGLLSVYKYASPVFMEYVKETMITKKTTFTFDFEEARKVRAVMVYNSKLENTAFHEISRIELVCVENGKEVTRFIKDLEFSKENYKSNELDNSMYYIIPGSATYAEFDELNVKSVRITVDVPEGQESVGISEVRILGQ